MEGHEQQIIDELRKQFYSAKVDKSKKIDKIRALEAKLQDMDKQIKLEMAKSKDPQPANLANQLHDEKTYLQIKSDNYTQGYLQAQDLNEKMKMVNSGGLYQAPSNLIINPVDLTAEARKSPRYNKQVRFDSSVVADTDKHTQPEDVTKSSLGDCNTNADTFDLKNMQKELVTIKSHRHQMSMSLHERMEKLQMEMNQD